MFGTAHFVLPRERRLYSAVGVDETTIEGSVEKQIGPVVMRVLKGLFIPRYGGHFA